MHYRLLGRTGVRVSPLCLGALNFVVNGWGNGRFARMETAGVLAIR